MTVAFSTWSFGGPHTIHRELNKVRVAGNHQVVCRSLLRVEFHYRARS